jgi:D-3-phosphoglycerate dehydrogenase
MKIVVAERITENAEKLLTGNTVVKGINTKDLEDTDALVVRTYTAVDEKLINSAPKLKYVVRCGVGLENVDLEACKSRGIKVINAPGSNADSVAEHTVLMILASMRNIVNSHNHISEWNREIFTGRELKSKVVGLLGFGAIGREVAKRLGGFGVEILAYDVFMDEEKARELQAKPVGLDELLVRSDIISIHVPLLESTHHMINDETIGTMKDGVVIVNTSRGAVIKEESLVSALSTGKVSFAALDVFENEPLSESNLLNLKNVILTPHIGGITHESFERMCSGPISEMLGDAGEG